MSELTLSVHIIFNMFKSYHDNMYEQNDSVFKQVLYLTS